MKGYAKPMKHLFTTIAIALAACLRASVPLSWTATPRNPAPVAFDRHHGETLEFRCVFSGFGELPFGQAADIRLWYQTNGMAAAWWSVPASVSSNVLSATFPPSADPGADRLALFFGAPSNAYASAVLRLRHSPGFAPNVLPPPEQATFEESDPVFSTWLATTNLVYAESDPTVPAWAKAETPPQTMTTNDVQAIVTNEVSVPRWTVVSMMGIETNFPIDITWGGETWSPSYFYIGGQDFVMQEPYPPAYTNKDATRLEYPWMWGHGPLVAQRTDVTYNALGLARLRDSREITNAIMPEIKMRTTAPEVKKIVTSLVTNYSEWVIYSTNNVPIANPSDFGHSEIVWNDGWPRIMLYMDMDWDGEYFVDCEPQTPGSTDPGATNLVYMIDAWYSNHQKYNPVVFRRNRISANSLGLARLIDLPPLTNSIPDTAARAVYDVHDLMWDATESILYWHKIRQGHDEYIAVTNIDLTNPANAAALKAWREANR